MATWNDDLNRASFDRLMESLIKMNSAGERCTTAFKVFGEAAAQAVGTTVTVSVAANTTPALRSLRSLDETFRRATAPAKVEQGARQIDLDDDV
jgi:hypothetical protein